MRIGIDRLVQDQFAPLRGKAVGIVVNQASIAADLRSTLDHFLAAHRAGTLQLSAVFGPQHGLFGHTQDNMVEWEGGRDPRFPFAIHSLYGAVREPAPEMLAGLDSLVIDLPDVGARYYTFAWTMAHCMRACAANGVPVIVLDRPNPIGGMSIEGPVLDPRYASFVGLHPLPIRHGMTLGEIARYLQSRFYPMCDLSVIEVEGWDRHRSAPYAELPWIPPSPNIPIPESALVYPGQCLLEGTNVSEGRGTTRPFECFGAPWIDGYALADALNGIALPGVWFRPIAFEPTFQKHAKRLCEGCFIHVTNAETYEPFATTVAILQVIAREHANHFRLNDPPYEYEDVHRPIDILLGRGDLWDRIANGEPLARLKGEWQAQLDDFDREWRQPHLTASRNP